MFARSIYVPLAWCRSTFLNLKAESSSNKRQNLSVIIFIQTFMKNFASLRNGKFKLFFL
jgi:hypothetical protein